MLAVTADSTHADDPLAGLVIGERPEPEPDDGWVNVQVKAVSLNHHDVWTLRGVGISQERLPMVLGCDAAGLDPDGNEVIVHSVITSPTAVADYGGEMLDPGLSLLSERHNGTFADLVAVPVRNLISKPAALSFEEAACLPTAYLTAYRALFTQAGLERGDTVLIQGAGGGVSTAAVILGRAAGLRIFVTSRSPERGARAVELGAEAAFGAGDRIPERVDAVLESVGEATWSHSLKALKPGGAIVVVGSTSGPNPPADLQRMFIRQVRVIGSMMGTREELIALADLLASSDVRPLIDTVMPLADADKAFARMVAGDLFGKVVLTREA